MRLIYSKNESENECFDPLSIERPCGEKLILLYDDDDAADAAHR